MNPYSSLCDDFGVYVYLNTKMELPSGRETVLHFFNSLDRGSKALTRRTVVVIVESIDRDVIRIRRPPGQREAAGFFGRRARIFIVSQIARREWFFANAAECEDEIERRARRKRQTFDLASGNRSAHNCASCIHLRSESVDHYRA